MNKIYALFLLLFVAAETDAQAYVPFPESNAIWLNMHEHDVFPGNQYSYIGFDNSDTVIGGVTYRKMYETTNDKVFDASEYIGALRQDTAARKVYFFAKGAGAEHLLYDFSLKVGDTAHFYNGTSAVVDSIDTILVDNAPRRFFRFSMGGGSNPISASSGWIEGIGNNVVGGLFGNPLMLATCSCNSYTVCFKQNGNWIYHNGTYFGGIADCDAAPLGVTVIVCPLAGVVSIYPNPVTGTSHLQVSGLGNNAQLCIYNITGIKVKTFSVTGNTDITLNKNDYPAGIYNYRITDEKGAAAVGKFVVE
ncbi:T9SS type A sorting domain-containing protein [Chitinophagaceae bacterium MMS25-I14]